MESEIPNKETNDSDSSEKSWVLVDENPSDKSQNTFVLNCNREPILELTQEDLGVEVSDGEFDLIEQDGSSDGISVISDEEMDCDPVEENLVETLASDSKHRVYVHSSNNRINNILNTALALSFITALSLGLGHYLGSTFDCSLKTIDDVDKLHDENEALKSRLLMLQNKDCHQADQNVVAEHCLRYDDLGSPQNLIKEFGNGELGADNSDKDPVGNSQPAMDEDPDVIETKEYAPETIKLETADVVKQKKAKENGESKMENKKRHVKEKKKKLRYKNEDDGDDEDEINDRPKKWKKRNKGNGRDGDDKQFRKWKKERKPLDDDLEDFDDDDDDDDDDDKKFKKSKKEKKKEDNYKKSKNSKHRSHENKNGGDRKRRNKLFVSERLNDTENVGGEWMERLAQARKEYRQNTKRGEWIFDRAIGRKNLRNKAKWYFDRMWDRQVYRQQSL